MSASPRLLGLMLAVLAGTVGCASVKSTFLERDPSDTMWMPSSGPINGVPVTLSVPSHVKVELVKYYYYLGKDQLLTIDVNKNTVPLVTYDFKYEIIQQKKVVLVDFK